MWILIREPERVLLTRDPGWKKFGSGSATLLTSTVLCMVCCKSLKRKKTSLGTVPVRFTVSKESVMFRQ